MLKSKFKHEMIDSLTTDQREELTSREDILSETQRFYQELFSEEAEVDVEAWEAALQEGLHLIKKKVSPVQSLLLEKIPDKEEIEKIIDLLPGPKKSPRLDGVTSDAIKELWPWIRKDCRDMIVAFWLDGRLTVNTKKGVIKLIPKSEDRSKLKDWRPILLLGITYKILSKLLAERLKPLLHELVNEQQTGFIPRRSIFDSILAVRLGQEWAETTCQKSIFLKLDFVKAYDRVNYNFLWSVLATMGFGDHFISLLKGLVENATSVVHLNGAFIDEGLEAGNGRQVLDALFAYDTRLLLEAEEDNWSKATAIIKIFEKISGAKLNVSKSLVVPIGFSEPPEWRRRTRTKLAMEGEVWSYMGCPIGVNLSEEQVCRRFVWGQNREGVERKAWISWEKMCRKKEEGGLGLVGFELHANALKMKLMVKILNNDDLDWVCLFKSMLEWKILDTQNRQCEIGRPNEVVLLLGKKLDLRDSPTVARILEGWWEVRKFLKLKPGVMLPADLVVGLALKAIPELEKYNEGDVRTSLKLQRRVGIRLLQDLTVDSMNRLELFELKSCGGRSVRAAEGPSTRITWWLRHKGLCVEERLLKISITNGSCPWYEDGLETIDHCLLSCNLVDRRWKRVLYLLRKVQPDEVTFGNLLDFLDSATQHKTLRLSLLLLLVMHTRMAWQDRCARSLQKRNSLAPIRVVLSKSVDIGKEILTVLGPGVRKDQAEESLTYLQLMMSEENRDTHKGELDTARLDRGTQSSGTSSDNSHWNELQRERSHSSRQEASNEEIPIDSTQHHCRDAVLDRALDQELAHLGFTELRLSSSELLSAEGRAPP
ncbi:hypothetical protein R1sor_002234 [Riccia sorocarpa]|uniref:Reverse transcriptase domain-containing protein n=1 Tax=Riccia sorocarpa TaxID=122646 RepID=A0ABD3GY80_9MARC